MALMPYSVSPRRNDQMRGPKPMKNSVTFMPAAWPSGSGRARAGRSSRRWRHDDRRSAHGAGARPTERPRATMRPAGAATSRRAPAIVGGSAPRRLGARSARRRRWPAVGLELVSVTGWLLSIDGSPAAIGPGALRSASMTASTIGRGASRHGGRGPPRAPRRSRSSAMRPGQEGVDGDLVGGVEPGRGGPPTPAGLVGQAEAGEGVEVGRLEVEAARARPSRCGRTGCRCGRDRPGRSRWAGACRASRAGRWWRRR